MLHTQSQDMETPGLILRKYQQTAVDKVRSLSSPWRRVLEAPTGAGKSLILADLLRDPCKHLVVSHRRVLLDQLARTLDRAGVRYGYRASGHQEDGRATVHLAMIQTEIRRKPLSDVDRVHIDEIHTVGGGTCLERIKVYEDAGADILGYTATPCNLRGRVDDVIRVTTVQKLVEQGYLCSPRVFGCGQPDAEALEKLRRDSNGEYLSGDVDKLVKPHVLFGPVVKHYRELSNGTPFVLFAHSVKSSLFWAQKMTAEGVPTASLDHKDIWTDGEFQKSNRKNRERVFRRIEEGSLSGLSNRFVLKIGFDLPAIGHAIVCCPLGTRQSWVQACGRVLRPHPNKEYAVIQDHGGSCILHPALDSDVPWEWDKSSSLAQRTRVSKMREDKIPEPIVCIQCKGVRATGDTCPYCGHRGKKLARYVLQVDGKLRLVHGKSFRSRPTEYKSGDEKLSSRLYWSAVKNGKRTAEQCRAYYAHKNNWRWIPRDLPYMPVREGDWFIPWRDVPKDRLIRPKGGFPWETE